MDLDMSVCIHMQYTSNQFWIQVPCTNKCHVNYYILYNTSSYQSAEGGPLRLNISRLLACCSERWPTSPFPSPWLRLVQRERTQNRVEWTVNGPPNFSSTVNTGGFTTGLTPIFTCCYSQAASRGDGQDSPPPPHAHRESEWRSQSYRFAYFPFDSEARLSRRCCRSTARPAPSF